MNDAGGAKLYDRLLFENWVNHPGALAPQDLYDDSYWATYFRQAGRHHVRIEGWLEEVRGDHGRPQTVAHGGIVGIAPGAPS